VKLVTTKEHSKKHAVTLSFIYPSFKKEDFGPLL
jgi:hypothetical protein